MRTMRALAILVALGTGCAHQLPSAGFDGFTVTRFQPQLATRPLRVDAITMDLELDFVVRNTLTRPLVVPPHQFTFRLGKVYSQTPTMPQQVVPRESVLHIKYPVHLQLDTNADGELKRLLGGEVPYSFSAEAKLDVPELVGEEVGGKDKDAVEGAMKGALALAGFKGDKLVFAHEGTIKLPLPPVIERPTSPPTVQLVGGTTSEVPGVRNVREKIEAVHSSLEPFVKTLQKNMNAGLPHTVSGEYLLKLILGEGNADKAIRVLRVAGIGVNTGEITLPNEIPSTPLAALQRFDPNAQAYWNRFESAWKDLDPSKYEGTLVIPTSLPRGATVNVPIRIRNPNSFPIHLPGMRVAAAGRDGAQLTRVQAVAKEDLGKPIDKPTEMFELAPGASTDLMLVSEIYWDALGSVLEGLRPDRIPVTIQGEVTVDLGIGRMVLPVEISP